MRSFIHANAARKVDAGCERHSATAGMIQLRVMDALYLRFLTLPVLGRLVNRLGTSIVLRSRQRVTGSRPLHAAPAVKPSYRWGSPRPGSLQPALARA